MNCVDCQERMQRCLDGEATSCDRASLASHLSHCSDCRDWYAAAQCLLDTLDRCAPPRPPAGLLERVCQQVMAERVRAARLRRLLVTPAVAAGLLLACCAVYIGSRAGSKVDVPQELARQRQVPQLPSLHRSIEEAGLAVVALTRRTADETMSETKLLLPMNITQPSVADAQEVNSAFEPPAQSLRDIQEGMSAGLEPVATSARRAVGLFWGSRQWAVSGAW